MVKKTYQRKAWAIEERGRLHLDKVTPFKRRTWGLLADEVEGSYGYRNDDPPSIRELKAYGYRCVRVTVSWDREG